MWSLFFLGDVKEMSARHAAQLEQARARGDRYGLFCLQTGLPVVATLAADEPQRARDAIDQVVADWSSSSFQFQHYWSLLSIGMVDLYRGDGAGAWERLTAAWPGLKRSWFLRIQNVRIEAAFLKARCAIASGRLDHALD